ncbi:kelch repeat and BTB domain-containing protein 13 [Betta splendens]|uniref:Kelch repeat and BTB domain-containing protein 13 n=1 Tax=Betta splendens TaxID=158456 RepID=A0A6P7M4C2_BETSP|nr:kelch repeat and BTB domain-containing protein 13 [Betta splendens]
MMEASSCSKSLHMLKVSIKNSSFFVDKGTLAENCEYFRALFESGMRECRQDEVRLQSVGVLGFLVLLQVLDGKRPMLSSDQIVEAIECAAFLQAPALTKHLMNTIDSDNCLVAYHAASTYGVWELFHGAALFIRDVYGDLRRDLLALPGVLVRHVESLPPSTYMAVCSHSPCSELLRDAQRTLRYLDEARREWRVLTQLPAGSSTAMAGVAVLDNRLYIVGGVRDVSKEVVETGFCYDPASNAWSTVRGPRQPRYNLALSGMEGCLYAVGGEYGMRALSSVERYKVAEGSWSAVAPLPSPAASVPSAVAMNRLFVCLWKGQGATELHEYVGELDQWSLVSTLVRRHSYALHMVAHRDNLYVMRNGPRDDFLRCVMDRYNLTSGQWTAVSGHYGNSKGSLLTAVVRGDSVFALSRHVTTEYTVDDCRWRVKREVGGFGRIGSIYTFLMRLPQATVPLTEKCLEVSQDQSLDVCPRLSPRCSDNM